MYADILEAKVVLSKPFVSGEMTFAELQQHALQLHLKHEELIKEQSEVNNAKKRDLQTLRDEWALDDNDKKKGKKVPPKKAAGSPDIPVDNTDAERNDAMTAIELQYDPQLNKLASQLQSSSAAMTAAVNGVSTVERCLTKLRATKAPLQPLEYSRGLSLAARDIAESGKVCTDASTASKKYGTPTGTVSCCMHIEHPTSARQTVIEALLALQDSTAHAIWIFLDPKATAAGCGWRRSKRKLAATTVLVATAFEEFGAIRSRSHVPLQDVKRILPLALQTSMSRMIQLHTKLDVHMLSPTEHPVECANETTLIIAADVGIHVCAVLSDAKDPEPTIPAVCTGEVLVQRCSDPRLVEVRCIPPHRGQFRITLFARSVDFSDGFTRIGAVDVQAAKWSILNTVVPFPTVTADFDERSATLVSPLEGTLLPETVYPFEIVLPISNYLHKDLERLATSLAAAESVAASSTASSDALFAAFEEASQLLREAQQKLAEEGEALQQEMANHQRELAKRKGKDADRGKQQITELEEQLQLLQAAVDERDAAVQVANDRIQAHRRATRRASAQRRRFESERQRCFSAADRTAPLSVEVSLDERRAFVPSVNDDNTRYRLSLRTPSSGSMTLFVNGSSLVTWNVSDA